MSVSCAPCGKAGRTEALSSQPSVKPTLTPRGPCDDSAFVSQNTIKTVTLLLLWQASKNNDFFICL